MPVSVSFSLAARDLDTLQQLSQPLVCDTSERHHGPERSGSGGEHLLALGLFDETERQWYVPVMALHIAARGRQDHDRAILLVPIEGCPWSLRNLNRKIISGTYH